MSKTSTSRKSSRRRLLRRQRLALALAVVLASPAAFAGVVPACGGCLPESGNVVSGAATSNLDVGVTMNPGPTTDNVMTITQTTPSAIIEWGTFSIDAGFTLNFIQPDANSVTLNRVIGFGYGPTPSYIQGSITATGNIFIVNPTGILFGKSSSVNVGGLVASTLDLSDADFAAGFAMADPHYIFTPTIRAGAPIVNQGQLTAAAGGTIALLAARIENQAGATIRAPGGSVVFGAALGVNLDFYDDGLTTVTLTGLGYSSPYGCAAGMSTSSCLGGIENSGLISSTGGHVELRTTTDDGAGQPVGTPLFTEASNGGRIWIGGTISAANSAVRAGSIVLDAGMGNVDIGGISGVAAFVGANAFGAGQNAGTVDISGFQLFTHVCVGPGGSCVANDSLGWIDATAQTGAGNGGKITINVQDLVYNAGVMQASSFSGNAGQIEITSGRNVENYNWILSESGAGNGGTINIIAPYILLHRGQLPWLGGPGILYSQAVLSAYGATNGGNVNLTGDLAVVDLGDVTPVDPEYKPVINVRGMNGDGGTVSVIGNLSVDIGPTWFVNADGTGTGGTINISAQYVDFAGSMTANGDVKGGMINIYSDYSLTVSGSMTANGDVDGGTITLDSGFYTTLTATGTLTANGGMTPLPANSIGNGGFITVSGDYVDLIGNVYARGGSQQSIDPINPGLSRYSFGGQVYVYGRNSLNLSGLFDTTALNSWGSVQTVAYDYLFAAPTTNVFSGEWFIGSNEVWVTTTAGASAHSQGAVLVDQTLAQSLDHGTSIYLQANNTFYNPSGSGAVNIEPGVSIVSGNGALSMDGLNGIYGSGFTMTAGWGVFLDAQGSALQLDNFTMDGYNVTMQGGSVSLQSGHIHTFGGGFSATANTGGIDLYSTWIDDSGSGDIRLDASGSMNGITAQWMYLDTGVGGDIIFDASDSAPGISISNAEFGAAGTTHAIMLYANNSASGIAIDNSTISAGASMVIEANDGGGISIYASTVAATGDYLHIYATGGTGGVVLNNSTFTNPAGGITVDASGSDGGIHIYGASSLASYGYITLDADNSIAGITIDESQIGDGGNTGTISIQANGSAYGILITDSTVTTTGHVQMSADGVQTGGSTIEFYSSTINGDAGITIDASGATANGIYLNDSSLLSHGDIVLYGNNAGHGIGIANYSAIDSYGGNVFIHADGIDGGITVVSGSSIDSGGGDITMTADGSHYGITLYHASVTSGLGDISMSADGGDIGMLIYSSTVSSSGGDINISGADSAVYGTRLVQATVTSGGGTIAIYGDNSASGIALSNSLVDSGSGGTLLHASNSGSGINVYGSQVYAGNAGITMDSTGGSGIRVTAGSTVETSGGHIDLLADDSAYGIYIDASAIQSAGGDIAMHATSYVGGGIKIQNAASIDSGGGAVLLDVSGGEFGIYLDGSSIASGDGSVTLDASGNHVGIQVSAAASITSTGGAITLSALGSHGGIMVDGSDIASSTGAITLEADSDYMYGVHVSNSGINSTGGDIRIAGSSSYSLGYGVQINANSVISSGGGDIWIVGTDVNGSGVWIEGSSLASTGGAISLQGTGGTIGGVDLYNATVDSSGGDIVVDGSATGNATGVNLSYSSMSSGDGSISMTGSATGFGWGVRLYASSLASTGGDIGLIGTAANGYGIALDSDSSPGSSITTGSGKISLVGNGAYAGVVLGDYSAITSGSGAVEIDGRGTTGAGVRLVSSSSVNAGSGTVVLRAGNDGNSDAIVLDGSITSTTAVNLRPLDETDTILLGAGNGFSVGNSDLANIHSPWLVIGSAQQQGAIQVIDALVYDSNLTLQNQGGSAGIYLGAGVDVGLHTLGLLTGGSITQDADAAIHAESLLAIAAGDVLLATAQNDVAGTTLSGSAGGVYEFLDVNALAIGNVNAFGFDANGNVLAGQAGSGISAGGNVFVQTLSGNLTMNANVNGVDVDLVTAGVFLNPAGATINASGDWRIWASTWLGEDRGGLAGNGSLPNLYNCTYGGPCGVTVGSGSHFIYTQQPTLTILIDDASREYGDANPSFNYSASGLILGDDLAYVLSGYLSSLATSGSNVGQYAITGNFTSAAGYAIAFTPGSLTITPATLLFTADPLLWYMGVPFPAFTGTITGFKNGDTAASVFGNNPYWFTNASPLSMPGFYAIYGGGNAQNYVFTQASSNQSALHLIPAAVTSDQPTTFVSERNDTDVYDTNIGQVEMCPVSDSGNDQALEGGDALGGDWSKVRKRLNLLNCFSNDKKGGCSGSF